MVVYFADFSSLWMYSIIKYPAIPHTKEMIIMMILGRMQTPVALVTKANRKPRDSHSL